MMGGAELQRLFFTTGLLIGFVALAPAAHASEDRLRGVTVEVRGNVVMVESVYLAILDLPSGAAADKKTADIVRRQILGFLDRAGYILASARVVPSGGRLLVDVDEGHVEKIVFIGAGSLRTLQLKLDLNMPHHVINLPHRNVRREIHGLGDRIVHVLLEGGLHAYVPRGIDVVGRNQYPSELSR